MEGWQARLEAEFESLNANARNSIEKQRVLLRNQLDHEQCGKCDVKTLPGDMLRLECATPDGIQHHRLCVDCLADKRERQLGWVDQHESFTKNYPVLADLILCHECHRPHVVKSKVEFCCGFDQKMRLRGRQHYYVDKAATARLAGNYEVKVRFQNQRRYLFSKFADHRLLSCIDACSAMSSAEGQPLTERDFELARDQVWLEEWTCDTASDRCDVLGWEYALNWPTSFISGTGWSSTATWRTFVRRRRMLRTAVTLGPALKNVETLGLGAAGAEKGKAANDETQSVAESANESVASPWSGAQTNVTARTAGFATATTLLRNISEHSVAAGVSSPTLRSSGASVQRRVASEQELRVVADDDHEETTREADRSQQKDLSRQHTQEHVDAPHGHEKRATHADPTATTTTLATAPPVRAQRHDDVEVPPPASSASGTNGVGSHPHPTAQHHAVESVEAADEMAAVPHVESNAGDEQQPTSSGGGGGAPSNGADVKRDDDEAAVVSQSVNAVSSAHLAVSTVDSAATEDTYSPRSEPQSPKVEAPRAAQDDETAEDNAPPLPKTEEVSALPPPERSSDI